MKRPDRLAVGRVVATWWLPTVIACAVGALYVCYSVAQWRALVVPSWDLGIFAEAVQAYSRFEAPIVPIKGPGYNLLGDHFHPILALLGIRSLKSAQDYRPDPGASITATKEAIEKGLGK